MVIKVLHVEIASFALLEEFHPHVCCIHPFPNVHVCSLSALLPVLFIRGHPQMCGCGTVEMPFSIPDIRDVGWRLPVCFCHCDNGVSQSCEGAHLCATFLANVSDKKVKHQWPLEGSDTGIQTRIAWDRNNGCNNLAYWNQMTFFCLQTMKQPLHWERPPLCRCTVFVFPVSAAITSTTGLLMIPEVPPAHL